MRLLNKRETRHASGLYARQLCQNVCNRTLLGIETYLGAKIQSATDVDLTDHVSCGSLHIMRGPLEDINGNVFAWLQDQEREAREEEHDDNRRVKDQESQEPADS